METLRRFILCYWIAIVLMILASSVAGDIINGGNYRIRSMFDGLYATAGHASFSHRSDADLGNITTEKWGNFREQRWDVIGLDQMGKEYWIFSQENTFNKMTAAIVDNKPDRHITELISVAPATYLIRSTVTGRCLDNPGYGLVVESLSCNDMSIQQRWEFDLLTKQ